MYVVQAEDSPINKTSKQQSSPKWMIRSIERVKMISTNNVHDSQSVVEEPSFVLNGFIFLGAVGQLKNPILSAILATSCKVRSCRS